MFDFPVSAVRACAVAVLLVMGLGGCETRGYTTVETAVVGMPDDQSALLRVAQRLQNRGDHPGAIQIFRRAYALDSDNVDALVGMGRSFLALGAQNRAAKAFREAVLIDQSHVPARLGLGQTLLALDRPARALDQFAAAHAVAPRDYRTVNALGVANDALGMHAEAQGHYRDALALAPDILSIRNNLGLSLALSGAHEEAIEVLRQATTMDGAGPRQYLNLALAFGLMGDDAMAVAISRDFVGLKSAERNADYWRMLRTLPHEALTRAVLHGEKPNVAVDMPPGLPAMPSGRSRGPDVVPLDPDATFDLPAAPRPPPDREMQAAPAPAFELPDEPAPAPPEPILPPDAKTAARDVIDRSAPPLVLVASRTVIAGPDPAAFRLIGAMESEPPSVKVGPAGPATPVAPAFVEPAFVEIVADAAEPAVKHDPPLAEGGPLIADSDPKALAAIAPKPYILPESETVPVAPSASAPAVERTEAAALTKLAALPADDAPPSGPKVDGVAGSAETQVVRPSAPSVTSPSVTSPSVTSPAVTSMTAETEDRPVAPDPARNPPPAPLGEADEDEGIRGFAWLGIGLAALAASFLIGRHFVKAEN